MVYFRAVGYAKSDETKRKLLSATGKLLRARGYAATGRSAIARVSRVPKGSLYHHFPGGKAEVAGAAVARSGDAIVTRLRDLADRERDPVLAMRPSRDGPVKQLPQRASPPRPPPATAPLPPPPPAAPPPPPRPPPPHPPPALPPPPPPPHPPPTPPPPAPPHPPPALPPPPPPPIAPADWCGAFHPSPPPYYQKYQINSPPPPQQKKKCN